MRSVKVYEEAWPLHSPFVISRGSRSEACVVVVEIEEDGVKGVGECTPYPRYGESLASVMAQIMTLVPALQTGLSREALQSELPGALRETPSTVRCGASRRQSSKSPWLRC
jgi:L-alanine-DL-glutamate epimerase and related enzymes of enolase superfamily